MERRGAAVSVFSFDDKPENHPRREWDIAFSLGGDGTVLYAARVLAGSETPILPINLGTLGFIAGVKADEWLAVFEQWLLGGARISRRCMLELSVKRRGAVVANNVFLNDAVISASGIAKLIKLDLCFEVTSGEYTELGFYRADGLIVATPTGSTAYSMAAGGPILDPEMEAVIVSPICPFTLSNRSLVLPSKPALLLTVAREQRSGVLLTVDGQDIFDLEPDDLITIRQADRQTPLISADRHAYYSALRGKLAWSAAGALQGGADA
jgi:NAD+ kinase